MVLARFRRARAEGLVAAGFDDVFYLGRNPDIAASGADPLAHFLSIGWREWRDPSAGFSVRFYLWQNPDVLRAGVNPFVHYLQTGRAEGRLPLPPPPPAEDIVLAGPQFDAAWYLRGFADHNRPDDALTHYLQLGWLEGREPAEWFSTPVYLAQASIAQAGRVNPFVQFLRGDPTLRARLFPAPATDAAFYQAQAFAVAPGPQYEPPAPPRLSGGPRARADVIAYYLPQFHATAENDAFWGAGFTEWRNVARGLPRYAGQIQPRLPRDLGFYSLDDPATYRRQIALARQAGIAAFCFYYYNFNGLRVLDRPSEAMLADPGADFPFLLMWANENWTRTWDGAADEVLLQQDYDPAQDAALCDDLARHFADPRYYRLNGRPVFVIYRAGAIPDAAARIAAWRRHWADRHRMAPLIFMAQTFSDHDPQPFGLDGAFEFPPHKANHFLPDRRDTVPMLDRNFEGRVYSYDDMLTFSAQEPDPAFPLVRCAFPSWDNESRRPGRGTCFAGATPARFQDWVSALIDWAELHPVEGRPIVAVNAWNEWAESAVLEPDMHHGHAWLNALGRAVFAPGPAKALPRPQP